MAILLCVAKTPKPICRKLSSLHVQISLRLQNKTTTTLFNNNRNTGTAYSANKYAKLT